MTDDLNRYRLDAAALAEIDRQIEVMTVAPDPQAVVAGLLAAPQSETVGIPAAVKLLALHNLCSAADAQDELFEALHSGALSLEMFV
jgi:hypothetical protein